MIYTRANIEDKAKSLGWKPIQIDGVPEGFSFKKPDIKIGNKKHIGAFIFFVPMTDKYLDGFEENVLLEKYKEEIKKRDGNK